MLLRRYHKKAAIEVTDEAVEEKNVTLEELTVAELKAFAAANNIDLGEATKKADILAAIKNA